jgi:molybdopterin synthase catalytic subunit
MLSYSAYVPLALRTMLSICQSVKEKHGLLGIAVTHRLGDIGIGEESVHVAVSAPHRSAAWRAGEETLELVKERVEVWKMECFEDGGVWRSNKDGQRGTMVDVAGQKVANEKKVVQVGETYEVEMTGN